MCMCVLGGTLLCGVSMCACWKDPCCRRCWIVFWSRGLRFSFTFLGLWTGFIIYVDFFLLLIFASASALATTTVFEFHWWWIWARDLWWKRVAILASFCDELSLKAANIMQLGEVNRWVVGGRRIAWPLVCWLQLWVCNQLLCRLWRVCGSCDTDVRAASDLPDPWCLTEALNLAYPSCMRSLGAAEMLVSDRSYKALKPPVPGPWGSCWLGDPSSESYGFLLAAGQCRSCEVALLLKARGSRWWWDLSS